MENSIDEVSIKISSDANSASSNLDKLANSISNLESKIDSIISKASSFDSILKKMKNLSSGKNVDSSIFGNLEKSITSMNQTAGKNNLSSLMKSLNQIPDISKKLDEKEITIFTKKVTQLTSALSPLANELVKVSSSFALLPSNLNKVNSALNSTKNAINKTKSSVGNNILNRLSSGLRFGVLIAGIRGVTNTLGQFVNSSNEYVENMNLFKVSMGEMTDEAQKFIDTFSENLGVDPSGLMRYMGLFNNLIEGFGIGSQEAYTMSKNLTQLSYDMSSYLNIPIDEAMQKLKSGISGEIEPMRAVGVALDQATLQETAYTLGIDKKVSAMTRAQKTELLYYQIMQKTKNMQGDMGRTILQPANALRILQQQFTQLGRAIGNIFIPILMSLVPYIMVVTKWLTALAQSIANFFGFEIPEIDYDNISSGLGDVSGAIDGIGDSSDNASKKLNRMLAKFDELNVIEFDDDKTSGSGSGSGGVGTGGSLGIPLPDYDAITGKFNAGLQEAEEKLKSILPYIEAIGIGMLAWKISSSVLKFLDSLGLIKDMESKLRILAGVSLMMAGGWLIYKGTKKLIEDGMTPETMLMLLSGGALTSVGGVLTFKKPALLKIGLSITIVFILLSSIIDWWKTYFDEQKRALYGNKQDLNLGEFINVSFSAIGQGFSIFLDQIFGEDFTNNLVKYQILLNNLWDNYLKPSVWNKRLEELWKTVQSVFAIGWNEVVTWWNSLGPIKWWNDNVAPWFTKEKWSGLYDNIKIALSDKWNEVVTWWSQNGLKKWWNDNVAPWFTWQRWHDLIQNALKAITDGFSNLDINFKLPHFSWETKTDNGWVGDILETLGLPRQIPQLKVKWYAEGGFPDEGELFVAREAGPELVGNIGNRAAVANNDQIVEGIKQGTYEAVSMAMRENKSNNQPIVVKIGEKTIYSGYASYVNDQSNMYGKNYIKT